MKGVNPVVHFQKFQTLLALTIATSDSNC